jgi:hypothetical protein
MPFKGDYSERAQSLSEELCPHRLDRSSHQRRVEERVALLA